MAVVIRLLLVVAFFVYSACYGEGTSAIFDNVFPIGTIGCKVSKNLCSPEEVCFDDGLFGNCREWNSPQDEYQFSPDDELYKYLRRQILNLIAEKYTWKDAYTQCVLQNSLVAYRFDVELDPDICEPYRSPIPDIVENEILEALENIYNNEQNKPTDDYLSSQFSPNSFKRDSNDEFIHLHKYFGRRPNPDKRYYDSYLFDYLKPIESQYPDGPYENSDSSLFDTRVAPADNDVYSRNLVDEEPNINYVQPTNDNRNYDDVIQLLMGKMKDMQLQNDFEENDVNEEQPMQALSDADEEIEDPLIASDSPNMLTDEDEPQYTALPPPDYKLLGDLLSGKVKPENLSDEQLDKMLKYIENKFAEEEQEAEEEAVDEVLSSNLADPEASLPDVESNEQVEPDSEVSDSDDDSSNDAVDEKVDNLLTAAVSLPINQNIEKKIVKEIPEDSSQKKIIKEVDTKDIVDPRYAYIAVDKDLDADKALDLIDGVRKLLHLSANDIADIRFYKNKITFQVLPSSNYNASLVAEETKVHANDIEKSTQLKIVETGVGRDDESQIEVASDDHNYVVLTFVLCGCIAGILLAVVGIYLFRRHHKSKQKLASLGGNPEGNEASADYQDLCRQRMQSKSSEKPEPLHAASRVGSTSEAQVRSPSSRSSTSSWSEEPAASNMDITTGHIVLSYMEDHLKNKDRLDQEWEGLCSYEADPSSTSVATEAANVRKNRYADILPYDHSRTVLATTANISGSDYINGSFMTDHDPRNPAYIATQGPLPHTVADFWQMVWEQGSVVIVMLTKLTENGEAMCHRYWPEEGSDLYHIYEVHLVSEHIWCDDYLVRSFYLKNLQTNETRTVTQFHFLTWPDLGVPNSIKALLDFRRKVNKSYRGRACPIVVHCSDGCGRTGTYILTDMVLNRMAKGAKEIDIAATLEHIRDQRMSMVKTKEQFQFSLAAVAEEVHAILKALPQ